MSDIFEEKKTLAENSKKINSLFRIEAEKRLKKLKRKRKTVRNVGNDEKAGATQ